MEARRPPEYTLKLSADRSNVKDVVKGSLHTIFFHRFFTPLHPAAHEVLDITLPYVSEDSIEALIDSKTIALVRALDTASTQQSPQYHPKTGRGTLVVQFSEKKRRKAGWFGAKGEEESVWESWIIDVTVTSARSEPEAARNRRAMETSLQDAVTDVVTIVNRDTDQIPPITTTDGNPFPHQILVNPRNDGWGQKLGIL